MRCPFCSYGESKVVDSRPTDDGERIRRRRECLRCQRRFTTYEAIETVPLQCMHCEDAPCASVCPTGAAHMGSDGIVEVDHGRCIGCLYCMAACPYQVRTRNSKTGEVDKCRFCTLSSYENGTKMCSCVDACLTGARIFGDLDDSDSEISKEIARTGAAPIAGDLTRAKIYYVR